MLCLLLTAAPACCRYATQAAVSSVARTRFAAASCPAWRGWLRLRDGPDREDVAFGMQCWIMIALSSCLRVSNSASGLDSVLTLILTHVACPEQLTVQSARHDIKYEPITLVVALVRGMRQLCSGSKLTSC